jgi:hypothetical protein
MDIFYLNFDNCYDYFSYNFVADMFEDIYWVTVCVKNVSIFFKFIILIILEL